jgi:hypothetical protein
VTVLIQSFVPGLPTSSPFGTFDVASPAHDEAAVAPLDQRRAAEQQALVGAGEAEIVGVTCLTETPDPVNHFGPMIGDLYALNPILST